MNLQPNPTKRIKDLANELVEKRAIEISSSDITDLTQYLDYYHSEMEYIFIKIDGSNPVKHKVINYSLTKNLN